MSGQLHAPWERAPSTRWMGGCRTGLDAVMKRNVLSMLGTELPIPQLSSLQPSWGVFKLCLSIHWTGMKIYNFTWDVINIFSSLILLDFIIRGRYCGTCITKREKCLCIYNANDTNFISADKEFQELRKISLFKSLVSTFQQLHRYIRFKGWVLSETCTETAMIYVSRCIHVTIMHFKRNAILSLLIDTLVHEMVCQLAKSCFS
jgi:hypothetical protein